jgi:putative transcriptional regulator
MDSAAFEQLLARLRRATQAGAEARAAGRAVRITAFSIRELRSWTELSQPDFAALLGVELSTLRNWEQGRREPTGPAQALLRAIHNDPENVSRALGRSSRSKVRRPRTRSEAVA